ncbi:MAG: DNA-binding response regulator [Candidatus Tokpelaia sp.]|nr:MAG: DNA-binding response regulator [Candidatus Tokpelaia sp.]KAA6207391.1 MAG: DNA-binding response regulator [Candidatus Tokpelaia sp.]KAA6405098.1 two-component system response regulator [Candidatus Tokpelaia sp.]
MTAKTSSSDAAAPESEAVAPKMVGKGLSLLLVDDNKIFLNRLARSFRQQGFTVLTCAAVKEAIALLQTASPHYAVVDLKLQDGNGMEIIKELRLVSPQTRALVLTGYGNIASAVNAVKMGVVDYLAKPTDVDSIYAALTSQPGDREEPAIKPMSVDRVRWEHIQRVYEMCGRNVSETARRLDMHRRTLQRILAKHAPR